ncbi:hypothetical protein QOT17_007638 [Balamuthia mandrillaris]
MRIQRKIERDGSRKRRSGEAKRESTKIHKLPEMEALPPPWTRTIHLDLSDCRQLLDEQVDTILRSLSTQLCSLDLSHCTYITDNGVRSLAHCSKLTSLSLASVPIDSATIHLVAEHCTLLQHLDICAVEFTQCIIDDLAELHELEVLLMNRTEMPKSHPEGLAHVFANCNKLRIVDLSNELLSDYHLEALASHCPSLERITIDNLGHSFVTCEGLERCATQLSRLEAMTLVPDESNDYRNVIFALRHCPCLREYKWDASRCYGPSLAEDFFDPLEPSLCNLTKLSIYYVDLQPHVLPMIARRCTNLVNFTMVYCSFTPESMNDIPTQRESFVSILRNNVDLQVLKIKHGIHICLNEQVIKQIGPSCPNLRTLHLSLADDTSVIIHSKSLEKLYITDAQKVAFDIDCPQLRLFSCAAVGMDPAQLDLWKTLLFHGSTLQMLCINTLLPEMLAELSKGWLFPLLRSLTVHRVTQQPLSIRNYFSDEECVSKYLDAFLQKRPHFCLPSHDLLDIKNVVPYPHLCQCLESIKITIEVDQGFAPIALNPFRNLISLSIMTSDNVTTTWLEALGTATPKLVDFVAYNNHAMTSFRLHHHSLRSIRLIRWHKLAEFELDCPNLCQIEMDNCSLNSERALATLSDSSTNNVPSLVDLRCQHESRHTIEPHNRMLTPEEAIVIQSCPVSVQRLSLKRTWHVVELDLSCPNLRTFKLHDMEFLKVLRLDCPKLQSLTVDIAPRLNNVTLNLPNLVQMVFLPAVLPEAEDMRDKQKQNLAYQQLLREFMLSSTTNNDELPKEENEEGEDEVFHLEILSSLPHLRYLSIQTLPTIGAEQSGRDGEEESEEQQGAIFTGYLPHYQALWHMLEQANGLLNLRVEAELLALGHPRWMQSLEGENAIPAEMTSEEAADVVFTHLRNTCPTLSNVELMKPYFESKYKLLRALILYEWSRRRS